MAKILENPNGRRSIRLSADDVLAIVSQYQHLFHSQAPKSHNQLVEQLKQQQYYLPEDL